METVSTIVTVYNLEACVEETLRSVMAQTYSALEIICVDDGSTDGSPAILARLAAEDPRIRVITQENAGVGKARNVGLAAATGTFVMILDGDDVFEPVMVERLVEAAHKGDTGGMDPDEGAKAAAEYTPV
ncbi:MAG: glycosyltransferase, partial [Eggerthellaceae bacterium]|nr:glycosyltransferase [Eggerthellaceae bacterium]